jgi:prefoldin subunit 5
VLYVIADQALLLPLTQSLYVKGKVAETEKVMVNIGTDYYVEVSHQHGACRPFLTVMFA